MNTIQLLSGPLSQSIGWALLHLLWQAAIVAGILAAVLALLPRTAAKARYASACGALFVVFLLFVATAVRAYDPAAEPIRTTPSTATAAAPTTMVSLSQVPALVASTAAATWRDRAAGAMATARQSLPSIVAIWLAGVVLLSSRLLLTWLRARRLVTHATSDASVAWQEAAARISDALGLRRAVRLLVSAAVEVPSVLGSLRPVILLPASTLTGLTPMQIEMVLAHELAHIRRHDFLINLLQAFVETLMFYHPAVWWMSSRVRVERENCCDDLAVAVCGDPVQYARALTRLEELRGNDLSIAVAADGGSLLDRIRRIAAGRAESTGTSSRWAAAVAMLLILGIAMIVPSFPALAQREEQRKDAPKAEQTQRAETTVEVVEETPEPESPALLTELAYEAAVPELDVELPDLDIETPDIDIEVPDVHITPPAIPPYPAIAPYAMVTPTPAPAPLASPAPAVPPVPPVAAVPGKTPRTPRPPRPPRAPMAMAAVLAGDFDDDEVDEKKFGTSGKLTVDELIQLRAVGVTPEYIHSMRAVYPDVTLGQLVHLRAVGVTPEYVREIRDAGFDVKSARDLQSLRAVGVTGDYIKAMRDAGVAIKTAREATSLRAVGVTAELVKQLAAAGYAGLTVEELTRMAAMGIDGNFIREMEKYRDKK